MPIGKARGLSIETVRSRLFSSGEPPRRVEENLNGLWVRK
jgi:hypothetical protein